jgi:hypothetical protein
LAVPGAREAFWTPAGGALKLSIHAHPREGCIQLETHDLKRLLARKDQIVKGLSLLRTRFAELSELVAGRKLNPQQQKACQKAAGEIRSRAQKLRDEFEPQMVLVTLADSVVEPPVEAPHELVRLHGEVYLLLDELNEAFGKG